MKKPKGAQQLILPLSHAQILAGYLNDTYKAYYGRDNYGIDLTDRTDPCVYAGGTGVVLATGKDDSLGNTVIVRYDNVFCPKSGEVLDIVVRYSFLSTITTAAGRPTVAGELIGLIGGTVLQNRGIMLHVEADMDLLCPTCTPSLSSEGGFLRPGNRRVPTTIDPTGLFCIGPGQKISILQPDWCAPESIDLPVIETYMPGSSLSVFKKFEEAAAQIRAQAELTQ